MGNRRKTSDLLLAFLLLTSTVTAQLALAQTSEPVLNHFDFDAIGPQAAGVPFNITVTAKDQYNQTLTSYNEANTWSSTLIIQNTRYYDYLGVNAAFVNGIWSGEITLSKGGGETYINTKGGGKDKASALFYVDGPALPSVLDHFDCSPINDRQTVGVPFSITITAKDQYNQSFTSYNGFNKWTVTTFGDVWIFYNGGTIGPFVNGVWSGQITLTEGTFSEGSARYGEYFTSGRYYVAGARGSLGTSGADKYGSTNRFIIDWPPTPTQPGQLSLLGFFISYIGPQAVNVPFPITIVAKGAGNQTLTSYHYKAYPTVIFEGRMPEFRNGMLVPTINPTSVGPFVDGVWNGQVTINETGVARIIVEGTNGDVSPRQGSSNEFTIDTNVHSSPETTSTPNVIPNPSRISPSPIPSPNASSTSATNIDPSSIIDSSDLTLYSGLTLVVAAFIVAILLVYYKKHKRGTV